VEKEKEKVQLKSQKGHWKRKGTKVQGTSLNLLFRWGRGLKYEKTNAPWEIGTRGNIVWEITPTRDIAEKPGDLYRLKIEKGKLRDSN